jgi:hypothetical protein
MELKNSAGFLSLQVIHLALPKIRMLKLGHRLSAEYSLAGSFQTKLGAVYWPGHNPRK